MVRIGAMVMNVKDARRAAEFWRQALGYAYRDGSYSDDATPVLVPDVLLGSLGSLGEEAAGLAGLALLPLALPLALDENDRTHLDLHTASAEEQQAEVLRLISLGATRVDWTYPEGARFVVLADPEGNLFCVINTDGE